MSDIVLALALCYLTLLCKKNAFEVVCYLFEIWEGQCLDFLFLHFELIYDTVEVKDFLSFTQDSSVVPVGRE